jgi:hypothetical protein
MPKIRTMDGQTDALDSLVFDLVEWVGKEPRTYRHVMDAWRTSCPRLTVEDALERRLLAREGESVVVTGAGRAFLQKHATGKS